MKRRISLPIVLAAVILLVSACNLFNLPFTASTPQPNSAGKSPFDISWNDLSLFRQELTSFYQGVLDALPRASIYHLAFNISDPPTSVSGVEEVRYTNQEDVALSEVDFAIFPEILGGSIAINNILLDGQPVTPTYSPGLMRVPLVSSLSPGQSVIFHIEFEVAVPTQGGDYYYGVFGYNEGILSLAHAYPTILVYNEQGWNNQTPDLDGDPLFSDASFYLVSINAPAGLTLVASGVEVERSETAGRQQVLYANGPARDFYLAAGPDFVKQTEKVGEVTFNSYAPSNAKAGANYALKTAEAAIDIFSRHYAPYPYTEFDIVPIVTAAGGVEFPGMTAIGEKVYSQGGFLEAAVAHEVGHQWFYNLVGNETQGQPWLDESLVQFIGWQYYLDRYGAQAAQSYQDAMQDNWNVVNGEDIPVGMAVSDYSSDGYIAIIYGRGMFFFQALQQEIGQPTFDSLMENYVAMYSWNIATTDDFKQLAEQHCNCDLTPLFLEWVFP